jgi:hypothetical protein
VPSDAPTLLGFNYISYVCELQLNLLIQFLTLPPGDERGRLVPVLQKILSLTPEETSKVHAVAKGKVYHYKLSVYVRKTA